MKNTHELIIKNGRFFDGLGNASAIRNIAIRDGIITHISDKPVDESGARVIDATGRWVMPGFLDTHTHYEAELVSEPGIRESVRHGVTTVITGSCSLSMVYSNALDCADLYSRVEALPYEPVLNILNKGMDWDGPEGWIRHLHNKALGPNVASMLGHSDIRANVMGLGRSTSGERPTEEERKRMVGLLEDSLDAGFVGMSTMTNPWDKLSGDRFRSRSLPSTYATWREYGWFHKVLRRAGRVLQSAPNLNTKVNIVRFFGASAGLLWRKPLKTTLISAADCKATTWLYPLFGGVTRFVNWILGACLRWQAIPRNFELYADGIDLVVFEEFGAGAEAMHLAEEVERNDLLKTEGYRRRFRKDFEKKFSPRIWHRDFYDVHIVGCPDVPLVGKSVGEVADERAIHPCDAFLDLVVAHGKEFRWKTTIANHRPEVLEKMLAASAVHVGFADSGAHLRNMAFYNFPLLLLKRARDAQGGPNPFMSVERAVQRLTSEPAQWFGLDTGTLEVGARADMAIINPAGLDEALFDYHEAPIQAMGGLRRMVRRNDLAVSATIIGGRLAFQEGQFTDEYGQERFGRFLRADVVDREPIERPQEALALSA
jgi:N-acyl-D-aspartate/D-glutamate deacylase